MGSSKLKKIFKGEFPKKISSLDDQVKIVTSAGELLKERADGGKSIDKKLNNLFLWLGGLNKDVQLYACKHLFNYRGLEFEADEKTEARLAYLEPFFKYEREDGYIATTFQSIDHRPWPVEFLDGTTFEDRLEDLAKEVLEEQSLDVVTVDMVLTGVHTSTVEDITQAYALVVACIDHIDQPFAVRQAEQIQRFSSWLEFQVPDIKLFGQSLVSKIGHIV